MRFSDLRLIEAAYSLAFIKKMQQVFNLQVETLANSLVKGHISLESFQTQLAELIKHVHVSAAVTGRGGDWAKMSPADWGRVGQIVRKQYGFLNGFGDAILAAAEKGDLTTAINMRAKLYGDAAVRETYNKFKALEQGVPLGKVPTWPGEGTDCNGACGCDWVFVAGAESWNCFWIVDAAKESCETCLDRGAMYNPYVIPFAA